MIIVSDLSKHDCITGFAGEWEPRRQWPLTDGGTVPVNGRLAGNELGLSHAACLSGLGIALMPSGVVADDLRSGVLHMVLPDQIGQETPVHLVYVDREYIDPKVRIFVDRAARVITAEMPRRFEGI